MLAAKAGGFIRKLIFTVVVPPDWKKPLLIIAVVSLAVFMGVLIARGEWVLPGAALAAAVAITLSRVVASNLSTFVLSCLIIGYIAGNRGFAQLSLSNSLPLLPAEIGLGITLVILVWQCARFRQLPWRRDEINFTLIAWIVIGSIRILWDVPAHGLAAIRDFAMVYYALFFFVAQHVTQEDADIRWFHRTLLAASAALLPLYLLFQAYPDFFLNVLTVRGTPLIFFKGDLAGTFLAVGSLAWFFQYDAQPRQWWALLLSVSMAGCMLATDNRASMLALTTPTLLLAVTGRTRLLKTLTVAAVVGASATAIGTHFSGQPWQNSPLVGIYERVISITDVGGDRSYLSTSAEPKGDNNRFRAVWWETVVRETTRANPWTGVGFGYDLADDFLKAYYPDSDEQFTARSPHNFFITIYARMGVIGVGLFVIALALLAVRARSIFRHEPSSEKILPWCVALSLLTSACFGVVLEGPMGAVVFWISLGLGAASAATKAAQPATLDSSRS